MNNRKIYYLYIFILLVSFIMISCGKLVKNDVSVQNVEVVDVPNDDGGGVVINWKPLPRENKIIEYRIYRGIHPDTLYYIGKIPINIKSGVIADTLKFYDKGYTFFVDANSPSKRKLEKGLPKGETRLYRSYPKDLSVIGPLFKYYKMLCIIPDKQYYYKTKKKLFVDIIDTEHGKKDTVEEYLSGLKIEQFSEIAAKLKPDQDYYYAVQAVNNSRKKSPLSKVVKIRTTDDPPERLNDFYAVNIIDKQRMHFEWSIPFFTSDLESYNIYLIDKDSEKHLIFHRITAFPYTSQTNCIVNYEDIKKLYPDFDENNIDNYCFDIGVKDNAGQETFYSDGNGIFAENITSKQLPTPVEFFTIKDNPNDSGEHILIYFGKPYAEVTRAEYSHNFKRLILNYYYKDNDIFKIKAIIFTIKDKKYTEYVLDKKIVVKVNWEPTEPIDINISFKVKTKKGGPSLPDDYKLTYTIDYDKEMERAYIVDKGIKYNYQVYKLSKAEEVYRFPKLIPYNWREYKDKVNYETDIYRGVAKYDNNYIYTSAYLCMDFDRDNNEIIFTDLYLDQLKKNKDISAKKIKKLNEKLLKPNLPDTLKYKIEQNIADYKKVISEDNLPNYLKEANRQSSDKKRIKFLAEMREKNIRTCTYFLRTTDGKGHFADTEHSEYIFPKPEWFDKNQILVLIFVLIFTLFVYYFIKSAQRGKEFYIRPIAGIQEIDNAIGRATEMGRPILYVNGLGYIEDVATLAGLAILSRVAKKAAEYDTKLLVPAFDYIVLPISQEIVKEAHYEAGRPDTYDKDNVFFVTDSQFAYVAGVNGIMIREKTATNFYMGMFYAESLLLTETGNMTGAIQIAGTDAVAQLPFFITTCDYTLIGEELYAAGAYLSRQPLIMGTLKAQDYAKLLIVACVIIGTFLSTAHLTFFMNLFPEK